MKTVLIVDDEQIVLDVLQRILMRLGYRTLIADSGDQALQMFNSNLYDVVLMDVLMPEKNGFEIARKMRTIRPNQKIVMVTGLGADAVAGKAVAESLSVDSVLSKPFSYEKVKSVLETVLDAGDAIATDEVVQNQW